MVYILLVGSHSVSPWRGRLALQEQRAILAARGGNSMNDFIIRA
jgi:hypothetical protein